MAPQKTFGAGTIRSNSLPDDAINLVRIQETEHSIDVLEMSLTSWLDRQDKKDIRKQYKTLLCTLRTQLRALITEVRVSFKNIYPSASRGAVYSACRLHDKRLLWIERLWTYFREKLDQRDNPLYRDVLAAADEVVWSCYAEPFRSTGRTHGSAPLPWLAGEYSPKAIARKDVPQNLRSDVDSEFLGKMLQELPVPIVSLPPQCVREPWWLIYLAHEIGHHVQFDLLPEEELVDDFRNLIKSAIPDGDAGERWRYRGEEIFADVYSLYMTGPWALWALTELEWTTDAAMINDQDVRYPAPTLRLLLMSNILDRMKLNGATALRGFPEAGALACHSEHSAIVGSIAEAVVTNPVASGKTLEQICAWRLTDHQGNQSPVTEWKETFLRTGGKAPDETLSAARIALAGGVAAWAEASLETDRGKRTKIKDELAPKLLKALRDSHEPVERAAQNEPQATSMKSARLISLLFDSDPARLGAW
jgi:hypothetical protein